MNKEPLIKYIRVDRTSNRVIIFLSKPKEDREYFTRELSKQGHNFIESTELLAGQKVDAIVLTLSSPVRNFEFKQNFRTNTCYVFLFLDDESAKHLHLPAVVN